MTLLLACAVATPIGAQTPDAYNEGYKLSSALSGKPLTGTQEIISLTANKSKTEAEAIRNNAMLPVKKNGTYQLTVELTDPQGKKTNLTGSKRIQYEYFHCLTVGSGGLVTVTPSEPAMCDGPEIPTLWVLLLNSAGQPISHNQYFFKVQGQ